MTVAEWLSKMTIGGAVRLILMVVAATVLSAHPIRIELKRKGVHWSTSSKKEKALFIEGLLTGLVLFSVPVILLQNDVTALY